MSDISVMAALTAFGWEVVFWIVVFWKVISNDESKEAKAEEVLGALQSVTVSFASRLFGTPSSQTRQQQPVTSKLLPAAQHADIS